MLTIYQVVVLLITKPNQKKYNEAIQYLSLANSSVTNCLETKTQLYLAYKNTGKPYQLKEYYNLINHSNDKFEFELNYNIFKLLEDTSYIKVAYTQVQENASTMEKKLGKKFLSYPITKAIVEEWEKVK